MAAFAKFDPWAELEKWKGEAAKAAKVAKVCEPTGREPETLAELATLAGARSPPGHDHRLPGDVAEPGAYEGRVSAWINTNPPAQPDPDTCAACGAALDKHFVILGDGAAIHYSGSHGLRCWERYQRQRRHEAEAAMGLTPPAE